MPQLFRPHCRRAPSSPLGTPPDRASQPGQAAFQLASGAGTDASAGWRMCLTWAVLCWACGVWPVQAQRIYSSTGATVGRMEGERIYNASGQTIGRFDGQRVDDSSGRNLGRIDGERVYSASGSLMGRFEGERLYDASGRLLGRIDGERLFDASGRSIGRVVGLRRMQIVVYFYFFM